MTDEELMKHVQTLVEALGPLIEAAGQNSQYHSKSVLITVRMDLRDVAKSLDWHANG